MRETNIKLFTFQRTMLGEGKQKLELPYGWNSSNEAVLVVTNDMKPKTKQLVQLAEDTKIPVEWTPGRYISPVNTGEYYFPFLERLDINRVKFTLEMMPLQQAALIWHESSGPEDPPVTVGEHHSKDASLTWVTASTLYMLKIEGAASDEFDWTCIGMQAIDSKKLTKRLQEITRLVKSATRRNLRVRVLDPHVNGEREPVEYYDGKSVVRRSALPRNIQREHHIMGRGFTEVNNLNGEPIDPYQTLVKGDFIVVDDESWIHGDYDVAIHIENAKNEFVMNRTGRFRQRWIGIGKKHVQINQDLWTWWPHHVLHEASWDHQTTLNFPKVYPVSAMQADLDAMMQGIREKLDKGLFPDEIAEGEIERDGAISFNAFSQDKANSEIAKYDSFANRVVAAIGSVKAFANLVFMKINGKAKSMASTLVLNDGPMHGYHQRHVITRRNNFRTTVLTTNFLKLFVGIEYEMNGNDLVYDDRWGMVWTGEAFRIRFNLHGGDDLDDVHGHMPIKVWGHETVVDQLKQQGVLMDDIEIPDSADRAVMVMFTDRLPVGAGEYSINRFDFSTWPKEIPFDESLVRTVNLSFRDGWPKPQGMVLPKTMTGLKTSRVYSKQVYTRADFMKDLQAQYCNPNFGSICNMLALYAHISNGGVPQCMPAMLGDIVDATQQGADIETFEQIAGIGALIQGEINKMAENRKIVVDRYTVARRASGLKVRGPRHERGLTSIEAPYREAYTGLINDAKTKYSFYMRNSDPTVQRVRMMSFTEAEINKALAFIEKLNDELRGVDMRTSEFVDKFNTIDDFVLKIISAFEREARHEVIDNAIQEIMDSSNWVRTALAIWHAILRPGLMGAHGGSDRPICQMGSSKCIADVILNALMEDGPTIVIGTNGKIADGKIDTVKRVLLKADRLSDTPEEVMHLASDRLADVKFAWVLSNNKPLAVFRKDADVFVKADVAIPDYLAW